jgi:purine-cytosine permease-like protein
MDATVKKFVDSHYARLRTHPNHWVRKTVGILLVIGGLLGFLPVLGYWMLPLGLGLLAVDWPVARRAYRRLLSWWGRWLRGLRLKARSAAQRRKAAGTPGRGSGP